MRFEVFKAGKTSTVVFCATAGSSQYFTGEKHCIHLTDITIWGQYAS
jgi:hypothetical protein